MKFVITGDNSDVLSSFLGVQRGVRDMAQTVEQQGQSIESVFNRIKSVASVAFAGFTAKEIVSTLANVRGEFQQSEIAFETMLGSASKAKIMIADLANLAATTPFDMRGVVSGAKSLLAYGFAADEVTDTMRRLGDICAGLGLNLQDMAWLYGTTMVQGQLFTQDFRQFTGRGIPLAEELAKQFGVTKDKVQELVTAGKVGFPEVKKALESMTNEGGKFGGLMEKQSHSITGQIANIEDTIEMAINDLGTQTEGIMNDALDITSAVIDHWKDIGEAILAAASAIGLYKAMSVGVAAFGAATANAGYAAELSALNALLPVKEEAKKTDLEEAVAKGRLSAAQAELVASKREEVQAYAESTAKKAKAAQEELASINDEVDALKNRDREAQLSLDYYEQQYEAAVKSGDGFAIETAENNLNTAASNKNATAKQLQAAQTRQTAAAKAAETATTEANTVAQGAETAATARGTAAKSIHAQFTLLCKKAQDAWNASMFSSPLFWIAAAIAGVSYAVYKLVTAESAHEKAVRKSNEAWEEFDNKVNERQKNIENLIRTIQSETETEYAKAEAYQKLSLLAPQLTEQYSQAQLASADFAKTQKEVAESMDGLKYDQAVAEVEKYRKKVEELSMTTQSVVGHTMGGTSNGRAYEQAKEDLEQAEKKLYNIILLREQAAENAKPIEVRLEEAKENEAVRKEIFDFYDEAIILANDWQAANETINYATGETRLDEFIAKAEKEIEDLRKDVEKNPADFKLQMKEEEKTKVLNHLLNMKDNWKTTGATTIPLIFKADWQTAQQSLNQAKNKAQALANSGSTESYAQAYTKAQKEYIAAKKKVTAMEKNKANYTVTQYETAKQDLKAAKDAYSNLGGDVSDKSAKDADTARKNRIKEEKQEVKLQEELNQKLKSLQQKNADEEIALMQDGTEKKRAEIRNDYRKRLSEIDKQEAEFKKKNKEAGKGGNLTGEQSDALNEARSLAKQEYDKQIEDTEKETLKTQLEAMRGYLKEYGTYQQQKLAIAEEYAEKIKAVNESADSAEAKAWKVKSLEAERDKATRQTELAAIKQRIDWGSVFGDFGAMFKDQLQPTIDDLRRLANSDEFKAATLEEKQTLYGLIDKLEQANTVWDGDIFKRVSDDLMAYQSAMAGYAAAQERERKATVALAEAQERLRKAETGGDEVGADIAKAEVRRASAELDQASASVQTFGAKVEQTSTDVQASSQQAANQLTQLKDGLSGLTSGSLASVAKAFAQIDKLFGGGDLEKNLSNTLAKGVQSLFGKDSKAARTLNEALGSSGMAGEIISAILGIFDMIAQSGVSGIVASLSDTVLGAVDGILGEVLSGDIITKSLESVGSGVRGILNTLTFGGLDSWAGGDSDKTLHEDLARLAETNEELQNVMENLSDTMADASIIGSKQVYELQRQNIEARQKNTKESMQRSADASSKGFLGIGSKASSYAKMNEGMSAEGWAKVSAAAGASVKTAQDFFSLTSEQMYNVAQYATEQYLQLKDLANDGMEDAAQYMDDYIGYWKELKEVEEAYYEHLTTVSFDTVVSDFRNALLDMDSEAEDFADDFEKYMQQAIVESLLVDQYKPLLETWYKNFAKFQENDGKLDEGEVAQLQKDMQAITDAALAGREELKKVFGWDTTSSGGQSSATTSATSLSEDTGKAIEGRFTAMQISTEGIGSSVIQSVQLLTGIATNGAATNSSVADIKNMMVMANSHLEDMVKYARLTYNNFGEKMDKMYTQLQKL